MSVWKEIRCDMNGPECYDDTNNNVIGFDTATALRKIAKRRGWIVRKGLDVCPACRKEPTNDT